MATTSQLTREQRIGVLLVCSMSLFIVGLDITAVNVALPSIGDELDAEPVLAAVVGQRLHAGRRPSLLLVAGSMADRIGRKRTLTIGLSVFTLASLLCSLASTVELLVAARVLQGVWRVDDEPGRHVDHHQHLHRPARACASRRRLGSRLRGVDGARADHRRRARLLGRLGVDLPGSTSPRPDGDRSCCAASCPSRKAEHPRRFDPVGQAAVVVPLSSVTYGIIEGPDSRCISAPIAASFLAAADRARRAADLRTAKGGAP